LLFYQCKGLHFKNDNEMKPLTFFDPLRYPEMKPLTFSGGWRLKKLMKMRGGRINGKDSELMEKKNPDAVVM